MRCGVSRSNCGETNRKRITQSSTANLWRCAVCGLMVVSSKQNTPIDEREVQGNVTRHFPVKMLRYATQRRATCRKSKWPATLASLELAAQHTDACWEDVLGLCLPLDHVRTYRSLNLREFEPERWILRRRHRPQLAHRQFSCSRLHTSSPARIVMQHLL